MGWGHKVGHIVQRSEGGAQIWFVRLERMGLLLDGGTIFIFVQALDFISLFTICEVKFVSVLAYIDIIVTRHYLTSGYSPLLIELAILPSFQGATKRGARLFPYLLNYWCLKYF